MIGVEAAIRRLAFAEARQSSAEAMIMIAAHRQELERAVAARSVTEDNAAAEAHDAVEEQQANALADRIKRLRHVDKKA